MCSTSSREPWKALLAVTAPSTSQIGRHAALARGRGALDHDAGRAHAEDHPVAAPIERQRGVLDQLVGGRGARGQEARADPRQQRLGGHVVGGHDHHAPAAPRADPVLGHRDGLRRARARRIDLRVRPARPDQLGELGVAHREHAEQEAAVEVVRLLLEGRARARRSGGRSRRGPRRRRHGRAPREQLLQPRALTRSVQNAFISSAKSAEPGKAEAKITPVSSRSASGSRHLSGSLVPRVVSL